MPEIPTSVFPSRFRRRLTIIFVVAVSLSSGLVAMGGFVFVSHQRHETFIDRARQQARFAFTLTQGQASADRMDALVSLARSRNGFETVVQADHVVSSRHDLTISDIPEAVREGEANELTSEFFSFDGEPFLVIGSTIPNSNGDARMYLLFSEREVREGLHELRTGLLGGWIIVTVLAALIGRFVARRTLAPVQQSADAARQIAEGMLHTRLAPGGRDEFGAWARTFNEMADALEAKISELSEARERERQFTADVAHDLRTPVAAMVSASSLVAKRIDDVPSDMRRPIELILSDIERLRRLITDLLELGELDAGSTKLDLECVVLRDCLENVIFLAGAGDHVELEAPETAVTIDRRRTERVVFNLLRNAMVHGAAPITLEAVQQADHLCIIVSDAGPGIPEETLPTIFQRFRKGSESRSTDGNGLGLAIVMKHVEAMGGVIIAENCEEGGACFRLEIPLANSPDGDE